MYYCSVEQLALFLKNLYQCSLPTIYLLLSPDSETFTSSEFIEIMPITYRGLISCKWTDATTPYLYGKHWNCCSVYEIFCCSWLLNHHWSRVLMLKLMLISMKLQHNTSAHLRAPSMAHLLHHVSWFYERNWAIIICSKPAIIHSISFWATGWANEKNLMISKRSGDSSKHSVNIRT